MTFKLLLIIAVCCVSHLLAVPVVGDEPKFRNDYTYLPSLKLFLKEHKLLQTWKDAVAKCSAEGATVLTPNSEAEAQAALLFKDNATLNLWLGIHDMFSEGEFITLTGKSLSQVFIKWAPGEPTNGNNVEHCIVINSKGLSNDVSCDRRLGFICAKESTNITKNPVCETYDMEYVYNHEAGRCYKVHTLPRSWNDAFKICKAEQSHLAIINSKEEAKILVDMVAKYPVESLHGTFDRFNVYLGFNDLITNGIFMTLNGKTLQDAGYDTWSKGQPDNDNNNERCGAMFLDGNLNDLNCANKAIFICEKALENHTELQNISIL